MPAVIISLTQSSPDSRINVPITFTATVAFGDNGAADAGLDWYVEFRGTGDRGWSSGPVAVDDGQATYERASAIAQTESVTAVIVGGDCDALASNAVTHTWWIPTITLTPDERSEVGSGPASVTATLRHGSARVVGQRVRLRVVNYFTNEVVLDEPRTTDDQGEITISWTTDAEAFEQIFATEDVPEGAATKRTTHIWYEDRAFPDALAVRFPDRDLRVGTFLPTTATLSAVDGEDPPQQIDFFVIREDTAAWEEASVADGAATFDYVRTEPGPGSPLARSPGTGMVAKSTEWWRPTLSLTTPGSSTVVGRTYTQMATLSHDGIPVVGADLTFVWGLDESDHATTDAQGQASMSWTQDEIGTEDVVVYETAALDDRQSAETRHSWVVAPGGDQVSVGLSQVNAAGRVGSGVQLSATVTVDGDPLEGWDVTFAGAGIDAKTAPTNAAGRASVTVSSPAALITDITATAGISGCTAAVSPSVRHQWWRPSVELRPRNTASPAREAATFTATVSYLDVDERTVAVPGQLVHFTMRSQDCAQPVVVRPARTNAAGVATVPLTRDGPSTDTVTAEEIGVVGPASDQTSHSWGSPDPPPLSITLDQSETPSRAGTTAQVTVTVHDADRTDGLAPARVPVTLLGVTPGGSNPKPTNRRGEVRFTFTSTDTTPTTLSASAPFGCGIVLSPPIIHEWFVPELSLTPSSGTSTTGQTATVTARLTHEGHGVANQEIELTIDNSEPAESTAKPTKTHPIRRQRRVQLEPAATGRRCTDGERDHSCPASAANGHPDLDGTPTAIDPTTVDAPADHPATVDHVATQHATTRHVEPS